MDIMEDTINKLQNASSGKTKKKSDKCECYYATCDSFLPFKNIAYIVITLFNFEEFSLQWKAEYDI